MYDSFDCPFDGYGNYIYNKEMFIDWQMNIFDYRNDWE